MAKRRWIGIAGLFGISLASLALAQDRLPIGLLTFGGGVASNGSLTVRGVTGEAVGVTSNQNHRLIVGLPFQLPVPASSPAVAASPSTPLPTSPSPTTAPTSAPPVATSPSSLPAAIEAGIDEVSKAVDVIRETIIAPVTPLTEQLLVPAAVIGTAVAVGTALAATVATVVSALATSVGAVVTTAAGLGGGVAAGVATIGATGAGAAVTTTSVLSNLWSLVIFVWNSLLEAIGLRKKRYPWGTVFDSSSDQPIELSIVRLFSAEGKLLETRVTDRAGRFGFLAAPGRYPLSVGKAGYQLVPVKEIHGSRYVPVWDGQPIAISSIGAPVAVNAPLAAEQQKKRFSIGRLLQTIQRPALLLTVPLAIWNYLVLPSALTGTVLAVTLGLVGLNWLILKPKYYGQVVGPDGKPIAHVILRLLRAQDGKPVATQISDALGQYSFLARPGSYRLQAIADGFTPPAWVINKKIISITKPDGGLIARRIALAAGKKVRPPVRTSTYRPVAPVPITPPQGLLHAPA